MFIDTYFPMVDGVVNVVHNYAQRLSESGYEVVVFCPRHDKKYVDNFGYKVVRCKGVKLFFLDYRLPVPAFDRQFKRALKESKLDIVHIHSPFMVSSLGIKYAKKHNIPVIATMHSQFKKDFYRATHSKLLTTILLKHVMNVFNRCDECFAVNSAVAKIFSDYGAKKYPSVLNNGTEFTPAQDKLAAAQSVNKKYGLSADVPVFIFVGRITLLKNVLFVADALAELNIPDYRMMFIGEGKDMPALKKRIKERGISDKVIFCGRVTGREELKALYCRATLFLFPSMYDASSLVQIEAASQGTPTLFLEGAATAATVKDNESGFIAPAPADPKTYARKIEEILADTALYEKVCKGCYSGLYRTWDDAVEELKEVYEKKCGE